MTTTTTADLSLLLDQARELRERFPELYAFLATRERAVERARAAIPPRGDIEAWVGFDAQEHLYRHVLTIPPGLRELIQMAERRDAPADGRAR
jgi:hypothetical protein